MIDDYAQILDVSNQAIMLGFAVLLRVGATIALLPAFGEQSLSSRVRIMLALVLTVIVAPSVAPEVSKLPLEQGFGLLFLTEPIIGLAYGLTLRLMIMALQIAGSIAAQSTSLSQIFGSAGLDPLPAIGHILMVSGLALATMSGLHIYIVEGFIMSYHAFPPGELPTADAFSNWGVTQVSSIFSLAFSLAAPFLIVSFLYNTALGVINRAMPQLMVSFVGAPAITAGGLLLMFASSPYLLTIWHDAFSAVLLDPFKGW